MSTQLTQEQGQLLKALKSIDIESHSHSFTQLPSLPTTQRNHKDLNQDNPILFEVDYDHQHSLIRDKLISYKNKSEQIYKVGELINQYQSKFTKLIEDKDRLVQMIENMKGSTSELVQKQKKMIDLSMKMKTSLDYYTYHDKFSFDYPCQISCREMFENLLQSTLSELTDGIEFFQQNTTYNQSKRYLQMFQASRSKILSFSKSFFIKIFNKEQIFLSKQAKSSLNGLIETLYPKSKIKFISAFLLNFPQFLSRLQNILRSVKECSTQQQIKFLELKQMQIYEFQLNTANLSLISYLQKFMPQIYDEAILKFFTFYRLTLHQNLSKVPFRKQGSFAQMFNQRFINMIYVVTCQFAYEIYCCRATSINGLQFVKSNITTIAKCYMQELMKLLKDQKNKEPIQLCELLTQLKEELPTFFNNIVKEQYESYAIGAAVNHVLNRLQYLDYLKILFQEFIKKILLQMETMCFNYLPKLVETREKKQVQKQIKKLLQSIPKLRYCQNQAERYMISALDTMVKSIKEVNTRIESRFQSYIWNLQLFGNIKCVLRKVRGNFIRRQLKIDVNNSTNMIERFKNIQRNESMLKYLQDIFNVIKTGMPVINQLTLDFNKYITEHCQALESQFVKDILYIYAKNIIEFLHKIAQSEENNQENIKEICTTQAVQHLYSTYVLSIEKYIKDACNLMGQWRLYKVGQQSEGIILSLLSQVYERLFDLLDKFYVTSSKFVNTENFQQIDKLKHLYKISW